MLRLREGLGGKEDQAPYAASPQTKSVFRSAVVLILLGILMVLVTLTNPSAMLMATATLLIGVVMIAIASFADL